MYPPKVVKKPRFSKLHEIRQPFFDLDHEKWKPQILQRIAQNLLNSPTHTANHVKLAQFTLISQLRTTDYQCATALERKENNSYITKTLTFSISGLDFRDKQSEFWKNNFIFLILAYSGSCTCL